MKESGTKYVRLKIRVKGSKRREIRMARYGISKEGADSMRNLAGSLRRGTEDIQEGGNTLRSSIASMGEELGIYEEEILEVVAEINLAQNKGHQAIETLITKANKKAAEIDALVSAGLA